MAASYRELLAQRAVLEKQIEQKRDEERGAIIEKIHELMRDYEISLDEIGGKRARKNAGGASAGSAAVAPKYRDPDSGKTWSGRGKPPAWIAGQPREKFLITD